MALRNIILIDEEKCDGCAKCVDACAEGAIRIIDGVAKLVSEIYCDGFGACLGSCPQDALTIEKREAPEYDEEAVEKHLDNQKHKSPEKLPQFQNHEDKIRQVAEQSHSCPGAAMRSMNRGKENLTSTGISHSSQLGHWPVQLMLVPPQAPFLKDSDLIICADCVPFTVPDFHSRYLSGKAVVVGCPKLDDLQHYYHKLIDIFREAVPQKVTVLKMEVPCCNGIAQAAIQALSEVDNEIPLEVHTIGIQGGIEIEINRKSKLTG